jgi:hypothetical protein
MCEMCDVVSLLQDCEDTQGDIEDKVFFNTLDEIYMLKYEYLLTDGITCNEFALDTVDIGIGTIQAIHISNRQRAMCNA